MSHRTQITLTDVQYERLRRESERTGLAIAELVRRSLDETFPQSTHDEFIDSLDKVFGIWAERDIDHVEYVKQFRPGLGQKFAEMS
ncbi:MAG: ribbon-helix-helix domain-containing protein [Thermomicrobiales bacterium]|nr:ribbon-helix-helix domain-containing protein [Thermomicrobiales bacterium]